MNKAIFIDKDGTLIKDVPYNVDPGKIEFAEDAIEALHLLTQDNFLLVVISNQPGIALNYFTEKELEIARRHIYHFLEQHGITLSGFYYCPHLENGITKEYTKKCDCRKPLPGLILRAAKELDINLKQSWMIGDILNDVEAGNAALCKTILIDNGNETEWIVNRVRTPRYIAKSLKEAAEIILQHEAVAII